MKADVCWREWLVIHVCFEPPFFWKCRLWFWREMEERMLCFEQFRLQQNVKVPTRKATLWFSEVVKLGRVWMLSPQPDFSQERVKVVYEAVHPESWGEFVLQW
ncbi:hypothetical protein DY000_02005942 [Brassica cretica]|uniref:Uncharacterized protein n=1 Tax=Brassica cretica TaxID=69181 RepID=A0ABQ7BSM4_BRACR|nr:hypothetical protein DY000_02005942 [Brassica cretica]